MGVGCKETGRPPERGAEFFSLVVMATLKGDQRGGMESSWSSRVGVGAQVSFKWTRNQRKNHFGGEEKGPTWASHPLYPELRKAWVWI